MKKIILAACISVALGLVSGAAVAGNGHGNSAWGHTRGLGHTYHAMVVPRQAVRVANPVVWSAPRPVVVAPNTAVVNPYYQPWPTLPVVGSVPYGTGYVAPTAPIVVNSNVVPGVTLTVNP